MLLVAVGRQSAPRRTRLGEETPDGTQAASTGEAETLKVSLETFARVDSDLHKRLVGEVRAGIKAQKMEVDVD